jgi:hypothetical protein
MWRYKSIPHKLSDRLKASFDATKYIAFGAHPALGNGQKGLKKAACSDEQAAFAFSA